MALSLLLDRISPQLPTRIGALELDASISESHDMENRATQFPVESGVTISDHIIKTPERVTIEGFITNSPVLSIFQADRWQSLSDKQDRVQEAFRLLRELRDERAIFSIQTGLQLYPNMVITRLHVPVDVTTGNAIRFTVDCQAVVYASSETAAVDAVEPIAENVSPAEDVQAQAPAEAEAGQQITEEANEVQASWLAQIIGSITGGGN